MALTLNILPYLNARLLFFRGLARLLFCFEFCHEITNSATKIMKADRTLPNELPLDEEEDEVVLVALALVPAKLYTLNLDPP